MPLFYTDSVTLAYSNVEGAKRWWIDAFDCKVARVTPDWDCPLPSDVALRLPGHSAPTILLSAKEAVDDDRRFLYTLTAGCAISGLLFWLAFLAWACTPRDSMGTHRVCPALVSI